MSAALHAPRAADAREILALTLWGEAGFRTARAMEAVASVVMTRVRLAAGAGGPGHLGQGIAGVCRAPFQFGCWHPASPRRRAIAEMDAAGDAALAVCRRVAQRAAAGALPDPTGGATHYHPADALPRWAIGRVATAEIGGLVFYRLLD